jgi:predicted O-methyltransferase YrrM
MGGMTVQAEFAFCPTLANMLEEQATSCRYPAISTVNNLRVIRALMAELHPARTLEVGLGFGASALAFCASHAEAGHGCAQHVAIDPFQSTVWRDTGIRAIERAGLAEYLEFRAGYSAIELPKLAAEGERFGVIYIDGSHLFEDVFVDAYFAVRLLDLRGVVLFDDSTDPHVAKVTRFLRRNGSGLERLGISAHRPDMLRYKFADYLGKTQLTGFRRIGPTERAWDAPFVSF